MDGDKNVTVINPNHNHERVKYKTTPDFLAITDEELEKINVEAEELRSKGSNIKGTSSAEYPDGFETHAKRKKPKT